MVIDELLHEAAQNNLNPDCVERYMLLDPFAQRFQLFSAYEIRAGLIGGEYLDALVIPTLILMDLEDVATCVRNYGIGYLHVPEIDLRPDMRFQPDHLPERFLSREVLEWLEDHMESGSHN